MALCLLFIIRLNFQALGMSQRIPVCSKTARFLTPRVRLFLEVLVPSTHLTDSPLFTDNIDVICVIARVSFLRVVREICFSHPSLACRWSSPHSHAILPVCKSVSKMSLLYKKTQLYWMRANTNDFVITC